MAAAGRRGTAGTNSEPAASGAIVGGDSTRGASGAIVGGDSTRGARASAARGCAILSGPDMAWRVLPLASALLVLLLPGSEQQVVSAAPAGRIRWITNRYLYAGNAAWFAAHPQLLAGGGTIPCCAGFGVNATGGFLQYDTPDQIRAYTQEPPYESVPVMPNIGMSLSTVIGDAAMHALSSDHQVLAAFAEACVSTSVQHNLTGLVMDYEPGSNPANVTAAQYAGVVRFITLRMHAEGKQFGLFLAGWGILGDWSAYKDTGADLFATMDYYPTVRLTS